MLTRSTEDLELLTHLLAPPVSSRGAGYTPSSRAYRLELPRPVKSALREFRVAVWSDDKLSPVDDDLVTAAEEVAAALEARGASVDRYARPDFDIGGNKGVYFALVAANRALMLGQESKTSLLTYKRAQETQQHTRASWERFFEEYDVLICPSLASNAFVKDESKRLSQRTIAITKHGKPMEIAYGDSFWWAFLTNVGHLPSTTFPAGRGKISGLPCGLNVVSREYNDLITIDFARLLKVECGYGFEPPPQFCQGAGTGATGGEGTNATGEKSKAKL